MKDLAENNVKKENIIKNKMFDQIERFTFAWAIYT